MKVIAVTGSFGSGKTTVGKMLKILGWPFVSADEIVSKLYAGKKAKKMLLKAFGKEIFLPSGKIDRKALARVVFSDKVLLQKLNSLIHPLVFLELEKTLRALSRQGKKFAVAEVPLLFESRQKFLCDFVVVVECRRKKQLARLLKKGFSKKDALERINAQMPIAKKIAKADFVIDNSGSFLQTKKHVKKVFEQLSFGLL